MSNSKVDTSDLSELHWMMDMITNVDVGLLVVDADYSIKMWNRFMQDHSGLTDMDVKDKIIFNVFPELPEAWFKHKIDSVFMLRNRSFTTWEQRPYLFKFKNYRPITGTESLMYQNATMIPLVSIDGTVKHVCVLIYDVTDVAISKKELKRLNSQLEQVNRLDGLTGLFNRTYWEEAFAIEFASSKRYGNASSVIIFDIDHFKKVNDTYGHQAGDEVIRTVAKTAKDLARTTDIIGRYGGEEFVVFLPNTDAEHAMVYAERLRSKIELLTVDYQDIPIDFTISLGVADFTDSLESHEQWIELADKALYHSKENGRNLITLADT